MRQWTGVLYGHQNSYCCHDNGCVFGLILLCNFKYRIICDHCIITAIGIP